MLRSTDSTERLCINSELKNKAQHERTSHASAMRTHKTCNSFWASAIRSISRSFQKPERINSDYWISFSKLVYKVYPNYVLIVYHGRKSYWSTLQWMTSQKILTSFLTSVFLWFLKRPYSFLELFYFSCSFAATLVLPFFSNGTMWKSRGFCKTKNF